MTGGIVISGVNGSTSRSVSGAGNTRGNGRRPATGVRKALRPRRSSPHVGAGANIPDVLTISELAQDIAPIEEDGKTPEAAKANQLKADDGYRYTDTADKVVSAQIAPLTLAALKEKAKFPVPTAGANLSTVAPLPSSTRRHAKEYFQRRTRERSAEGETGPTCRGTTVADPGGQSNGEAANPRLPVKEDASGSRKLSVPMPNKKHDQFAFDPEASPFTPHATSSPRQGSPTSIGVQSFSSPTPLPPHGNRNVEPLTLVKTSGKTNAPETNDSSSQPIPMTSHGTQGEQGDNYVYYPGTNGVQAHLQAEQLALMRLQAYYSWLAGNMSTSVGLVNATEHVDMSGGGGGLSGGVALGRQGGQSRGHGKVQPRNASGAYSHKRARLVYSP